MSEFRRLAEVKQILESRDEFAKPLGGLAEMVATFCGTPIAMINLIDENSVWTISSYGAEAMKVPRCDSFCDFTMYSGSMIEIPETREDARVRENPYVIGDPHVRFYAGQPLISRTGQHLGTICVLDREPRRLSDSGRAQLIKCAEIATALLEASGAATLNRTTETNSARERDFLGAVLDSVAEAVIGCDADGKLTLFNRAAREFHGLDADYDISGPDWAEHYGLFQIDGVTPLEFNQIPLLRAFHGEKVREVEMLIRPKHLPVRRVACNGQAILNGAGERVGAVVTMHDVTELKEKERLLVETNLALTLATQAKSEFLANMSHEIRTPLNGIVGMTELIADSELSVEQREQLVLIRSSANHLSTVVNDILDFSKIEAGKLQIDKIDFQLSDILSDVHSAVVQSASSKGLRLIWPAPSPLAQTFHGDPNRIRQILLNLVGNAVKFTSRGMITCAVETIHEGPTATGLRIQISDSGIGMTDEVVNRLFRPFTQADSSTSRRHGGTGLGLSISKHLVELMGGRIGVESVVGHGSTFWFELPLTVVSVNTLPQKPKPRTAPLKVSGGNFSVLVAEDNVVNQRIAATMLQKMGVNVVIAVDGLDAVEKVRTQHFDLVLMDCQMPNLDGYEATKRIRSDKQSGSYDIKIVALTANAMKGDRERCLDAGMDGYITKPFKKADLETLIQSLTAAKAS